MKLELDEQNLIIYDNLKHNCSNKTKILKLHLYEHGFYKYRIVNQVNDPNRLDFGFNYIDFKKIYNYSGKEFLEKEFSDFPHELNKEIYGEVFDIGFTIDISKYSKCINKKIPKDISEEEKQKMISDLESLTQEMEQNAEKIAKKFSRFRLDFFASAIVKYCNDIEKDSKNLPESMTVKVNKNNILYLIPTNEKLILAYGLNDEEPTEIALAKVFYRELQDAKVNVSNTVDAIFYNEGVDLPDIIKSTKSDIEKFNVGYISFSKYLYVFYYILLLYILIIDVYPKQLKTLLPKLGFLINLKYYAQFHIQSVKSFLHIRMNKKYKDLQIKIDNTKIISNDVSKAVESTNFFSQRDKKNEEMKLFNNEFTKVNI